MRLLTAIAVINLLHNSAAPRELQGQAPDDDAWAVVREAIDSFALIPAVYMVVATNSGDVVFTHSKGGVSEDSTQQIWSSTKWVAGAAIMREVERGTVELDAPIHEYLPWWTSDPADSRSAITLRHLLGFASGYADVTQTSGYLLPLACTEATRACAQQLFEQRQHPSAAGSRIDYNSIHLALAGAVVEQALGEPVYDTINRNVLQPAGMTSTSFWSHSNDNPFLAGGISSTPRDYMAFLSSFVAGEIVSNSTIAAMLSDAFPAANKTGLFAITAARYGLTTWYECPVFIAPNPDDWSQACIDAQIHSSPGASGTYPVVDRANGFFYFFGMDGAVGLGAAISAVFRDTLKPLVDAAVAGVADRSLPTAVPAKRVACLTQLVAAEEERERIEGDRYDASARWLQLRQRC
jgi:CubicO group peptidase (beta-lactamase class C family)